MQTLKKVYISTLCRTLCVSKFVQCTNLKHINIKLKLNFLI